jgi:RNA polymerase sigma factor (sigma-70 family)
MGQNDREIWLLLNDPGKLIALYQDLITVIVHKYKRLGYVTVRESDDLVQDVNHKLLERIARIQDQYNGKSQLRTYFSVIIRNICREEFRKNPKLEEPQPPDYHRLEKSEFPIDRFIIRQEYERFEKVLKLLFDDRSRFILMFWYMVNLKISAQLLESLYPDIKIENLEGLEEQLNESGEKTKKERFENLSEILQVFEGYYTSPDSLRKWYFSRSKDCVDRMNGNPPRSGYNLESIQILIEKQEILKKH